MSAPTLPDTTDPTTRPRSLTLTVQPGGITPADYAGAILTGLAVLLGPLEAELDDVADAVQDDDDERKRVARTAEILRDSRDYLREQLDQAVRVLAEHHRTF